MEQDEYGPNDDRSALVISDEVLAAIAVTAAREAEGVSALAPRPPEIARLFKGEHLRYVKITRDGDELSVDLALRVRAGTKVTEAASGVQRAVRGALCDMTEKTVAKVNIKILGVDP